MKAPPIPMLRAPGLAKFSGYDGELVSQHSVEPAAILQPRLTRPPRRSVETPPGPASMFDL